MRTDRHDKANNRFPEFCEGAKKKRINHLNAELNPIRHLLALVGARHIVHVSRARVKPTLRTDLNCAIVSICKHISPSLSKQVLNTERYGSVVCSSCSNTSRFTAVSATQTQQYLSTYTCRTRIYRRVTLHNIYFVHTTLVSFCVAIHLVKVRPN